MPPPNDIRLRLHPDLFAAVAAAAEEQGVSVQHLIERVLNAQLLSRTTSVEVQRHDAELKLFQWVESAVEALQRSGAWDEHVTLRVFEQLQREVPQLYSNAAAGDQKRRINQEIGARIREALCARPKLRNGRPVIARVPVASNAPIRVYTLLEPPSEGNNHA